MKIEQKKEFQPIVITLETPEEARSLLRALRAFPIEKREDFECLVKMTNWLKSNVNP